MYGEALDGEDGCFGCGAYVSKRLKAGRALNLLRWFVVDEGGWFESDGLRQREELRLDGAGGRDRMRACHPIRR